MTIRKYHAARAGQSSTLTLAGINKVAPSLQCFTGIQKSICMSSLYKEK